MEKSKTEKKQHVNICMPKEIVVEILRRVPCQDLHETLKKVCMQWCSIIYSGSFAYSHVEHGILKSSSSFSQLEAVVLNTTDDTRSVTVSALEWHRSFPNYIHQECDENWETRYMYTLHDVSEHSRDMTPVNSVNGFICFWSYKARFHVCNPMTKEYFTTPPYSYGICPPAAGFGFCQLSYEYKVIVLHDDAAMLRYGDIKPLVFTVGTDRSWRPLKAISDRKFLSRIEKAAHVKGVLYWYMESYNDPKDWPRLRSTNTIKSLVCFDVSKEEVVMIMVPAELDSQEEEVTRITEKGGNLCLINISYGPLYSVLIKVYIAQSTTSTDLSRLSTWKKEFNVTVPNMAYYIDMTSLFVSIVTDDMLVIQLECTEIFIDVATGMLSSVYPNHGNFIPYVPSLVSLSHRPC